MKSVKLVIEYTQTVETCLADIANHLRMGGVEPAPILTNVIEQFEKTVTVFPLGCQICPELLKLGCARYRECNSEDGYRVLYSVEEDLITVHAILSHRQDIKQLLFKRLIQA